MKLSSALLLRRLALLLLACATALAGVARAQNEPAPFKPEEIEALVAPIALYPDSLLTQVLMASTYPLEVVQAARWVKANPKMKGDAAVKAVANEPWDVSVKSLVAFPQALEPMNEKLDWTQKLGDAFLADQKAVLDAVQRLRKRAEAAGSLKSTEQQKVIVEQTVIKVEPANPEVIYVPAYNPTVVYGTWAYPAYPPYYWPPPAAYYPGGYVGAGLAWGLGVAGAAAIYSNANWGRGDVDINVNKSNNIDRSSTRSSASGGGKWQHDPSHRKGASYRDNATREKYGKGGVGGADGRRDYRGREGGAGDRAGTADRAGPSDRGGAGDRASASDRGRGGDRGGAADRAGTADRGGSGRDNAFSGVGGGGATQRDMDRGRASNQSMASNRGSAGASSRSSSGASRGGGGASRGGGGASRGGGGGGRGGGRR
jgi:hypothetical protein